MPLALASPCNGSRAGYMRARASSSGAAQPSRVAACRSLMHSSQAHLTSWDDSRQSAQWLQQSLPAAGAGATSQSGCPRREVVRLGNKGTGGIFAPLVVVARNIMGAKEFNKFRGKGISLHSQVIKEFGKQFGVDGKQIQGLIRTAKKNGEKLGFLA